MSAFLSDTLGLTEVSHIRSLLTRLQIAKAIKKAPNTSSLKVLAQEDKLTFKYSDVEQILADEVLVNRIVNRINNGSLVMKRMSDIEIQTREGIIKGLNAKGVKKTLTSPKGKKKVET